MIITKDNNRPSIEGIYGKRIMFIDNFLLKFLCLENYNGNYFQILIPHDLWCKLYFIQTVTEPNPLDDVL